MPYLGESIPKLGFGLMRLPMLGGDVDIGQVKQMVDLFLARGFTYFDTAWGYLDGKSELAARAALVDRYPRERFQLATKLPAWCGPKTAREAQDMFYTSLGRTGAGYFDFYLLHNLGDMLTRSFDEFGIWDFVKARKEEGLIKHYGFSFHDKADVLDALLTAHPDVEFVQLQINYADWESPGVESRKCYEVARRHGKPVVIMEPIRGGMLASLPESVEKVLRRDDPAQSAPSWALRFAASLEGVVTVLSGMSTLAQMEENTAMMQGFLPLSARERETVAEAGEALAKIPTVPCTDCRYCRKGCPQQIAIPGVFRAVNIFKTYGDRAAAKGKYGWETRDGGTAGKCVACGACERVCPQHIPIIEELRKAAALLES